MQLLVVLTALESRVIEAASNDTVSTHDNDDDNLYLHQHLFIFSYEVETNISKLN